MNRNKTACSAFLAGLASSVGWLYVINICILSFTYIPYTIVVITSQVTSLIIVQLSKICVADFKIRVATFQIRGAGLQIRTESIHPPRLGDLHLGPPFLAVYYFLFCLVLINYMHFATMQHPWDC